MGVVGSTTPRLFTPPLRELTPDTSWGYDVAWFAREILGEPLTAWQEWLSIHALETLPFEAALEQAKTTAEIAEVQRLYRPSMSKKKSVPPVPTGILRFKTILVLVARQNGKTHWSKVLIKWALFRKRLPYILGAAQTKNDASELWEEIRDECEGHPKLKKHMRRTSNAHGFEALRSKTGVYRIAGLDRNAGRGKTVNCLYMDELREHKTWDGWNALSSTTMSPMLGFNVATSNAGDYRSVVLQSLRKKTLASIKRGRTNTSVGIFEWSADPNKAIDDRDGWAQANPDLGHGRMAERDIQAEFETKDEDSFRTENLCQWVDDLDKDEFVPVLTPEEVEDMTTTGVPMSTLRGLRLVLDADPNRRMISMAIAGRKPDGTVVGAVGYHGDLNTADILAEVAALSTQMDFESIHIDPRNPAWTVGEALSREGWHVEKLQFKNVKDSTASFLQAHRDQNMWIQDPSGLIASAFTHAQLKEQDSGEVKWVSDGGIICQLTSVSFAMWAALNIDPITPQRRSRAKGRIIKSTAKRQSMQF